MEICRNRLLHTVTTTQATTLPGATTVAVIVFAQAPTMGTATRTTSGQLRLTAAITGHTISTMVDGIRSQTILPTPFRRGVSGAGNEAFNHIKIRKLSSLLCQGGAKKEYSTRQKRFFETNLNIMQKSELWKFAENRLLRTVTTTQVTALLSAATAAVIVLAQAPTTGTATRTTIGRLRLTVATTTISTCRMVIGTTITITPQPPTRRGVSGAESIL